MTLMNGLRNDGDAVYSQPSGSVCSGVLSQPVTHASPGGAAHVSTRCSPSSAAGSRDLLLRLFSQQRRGATRLVGAMDDIAHMALEAAGAATRQRRDQTGHARASAIRKRAAGCEIGRLSGAGLEVAALTLPGAAAILGVKPKTLKSASPQALLRLALSPKVRGTGPAVDRVRAAQQTGFALVATAALHAQESGLLQWLDAPAAPRGHEGGDESQAPAVPRGHERADAAVRGITAMWDEASQRARALLRGRHVSRAQSTVEVLVMLGALHDVTVDADGVERWAWQPWLAPPILLHSTQHRVLSDALDSCMPFAFSVRRVSCDSARV